MTPRSNSGPETSSPETFYSGITSQSGTGLQSDFYSLLMQAPVAIVIFSGPDYIIELVNDLYLPIAGKSRDELLHKPAFETMPVAASQGFIELLDTIRASGESFTLHEHKTLVERNGQVETTYLNIVYQPVKEADGTVNKIMILITDVTEQIAAREKMSEAEIKFRSLIENSQDVISLTDGNWSITYISSSIKKVFGYDEEELLGRNGLHFMHPDDIAVITKDAEKIMVPNGTMVQTVRFRHKNGSWRWIESTVTNLLHMPHIHAFVSNFHDITEQKETAEKSKESAEQFRMLADSISQLAWMADADGFIYWYNQRWYDFTGTTLDEMQGWGWKKVHHPDHMESVVAFVKEAWHNDVPYELTFPLKRKDGVYRWFLTRVYPVKNGDGRVMQWIGTNTDVTEQRETEEALKKMKSQLELTFQNVPSAIYHFDKTGKLLFLNEQGAQLLGYATVEEVLQEKDVYQLRRTLDATFYVLKESGSPLPVEESSVALTLRTGKPSEVICEFINKKTHHSFWLLSRSAPLFDGNGELSIVLTTFTDITLQKKSEQDIRQSAERFRTLAEALPQLVWTTDAAGNQEFASSRWEEYTGLDPKGLDTWQQIIHADDMAPLMRLWTECLQTGKTYKGEARLKSIAGAYRWHLVHGEPLRDETGTILKWVGAFTDIHEQQQAEEAVKQSSENFRQLADLVPQIIWTARPDGYLDYYNSRWYELTGFKKDFGDQSWIPILHPADVQLCMDTWYHSVQSGTPYNIEYRFKDHRTGKYRWFLGKALPIRNKDGTITKWFGTCTDIHDQRAMTEKLEQLVALRTKELQRSNDDLQQFAHVASHDLKEPVRKIRTFSSRLSYEFGEILPEKATTYIEKIEAAATRMYMMIDGVLDYSIVSTAEQPLETIDLSETIRHIENDLELVIHQKHAVIQYQNLPVFEGAAILIHQLFYNLINNALKFARADIAPLIQISSAEINSGAAQEQGLYNAGNYVQVTLQDNGIGFSQEHAERIFKTFTRLNAKDKYEGTGLGLALCKKIVERHHGAISAAGMEGMGAIFKIILPLQQPKKET